MNVSLVSLPRSLRKGIDRRLPRGHRFKDLTGRTFKDRKVLGFAGYKGKFAAWLCRCKCGQLAVIPGAYFVNGTMASCGCSVRLSTAAKELKPLLASIKARCDYPYHPAYKYYGARGITVCKRWRDSVEALAKDMGPRPNPKHCPPQSKRELHAEQLRLGIA